MASCRPWLRLRALKKVPGNLAHIKDASDLVQECQAAATKKFEQFRGEDIRSFRNWLAVILEPPDLSRSPFPGTGQARLETKPVARRGGRPG